MGLDFDISKLTPRVFFKCLPTFATVSKCQQFPALLMSVSFRPYLVYIRGYQPMGCGPVGGNGIIVKVVQMHTSVGTKHQL
jgi:hypothetical protein